MNEAKSLSIGTNLSISQNYQLIKFILIMNSVSQSVSQSFSQPIIHAFIESFSNSIKVDAHESNGIVGMPGHMCTSWFATACGSVCVWKCRTCVW